LKITLRSDDSRTSSKTDVDLVLAGRGLALAELDRDAGRGHLVAQQAWSSCATRLMPTMFMANWMSMSTPIVTSNAPARSRGDAGRGRPA
jgi:hypothetical protein